MDYFAFQWHITDECDQRCKHCYIFSSPNRPKMAGMLHADALDQFLLRAVELVHVAVNLVQVNVLVIVGLEVVNCGQLAARLGQTRNDQMPQNLIPDRVEADAVIYPAQKQLRAVDQQRVHVGHHTLGLLAFTPAAVVKVYQLLTAVGLNPLPGLNT